MLKIQIAGPITTDSDLVGLKCGGPESVYKAVGISESGDSLLTLRDIISILDNGLFKGCGFGAMEKKRMRGWEGRKGSGKYKQMNKIKE